MKLNLGSGTIRKKGYVDIDLYRDCDLKWDLRQELPYDGESISEIYASHLIEHLTRREFEAVLPNWYHVLKKGGVLEIHCPDLDQICSSWASGDQRELKMMLYGGQEDFGKGECHKNGFTLTELVRELTEVGFKIRETEAKNFNLKVVAKK